MKQYNGQFNHNYNPIPRNIKFKQWLSYGVWRKFIWLENYNKMNKWQKFILYWFGADIGKKIN